jgi:hypothetical protein
MRTADGAGEVSVPAYELWSWTAVLGGQSFMVMVDDTPERG